MKIEGWFLPVLAGLIPFLIGTVLPALGFESLSWLASKGVQKLTGNGLYLKKSQIETDWSGLYLGPTSGKGFETWRNCLYLMKHDGRGLILGPNSPFKNIPILCMIYFQKKKCYIDQKMVVAEIDGNYGHIYRLKNWRHTGNVNHIKT